MGLDKDVDHVAVLVDRTPEIVSLALAQSANHCLKLTIPGKGIPWRIRGSVVRYWHPDIEKREKRDLQTGYLGNPGSLLSGARGAPQRRKLGWELVW